MQLNSMKPAPGSRRPKKRIGRGPGSGTGKTAARGHKGAGARAGAKISPAFEGGQMPLARRLPKRGFKNPNRVVFEVVNIGDLNRFDAGMEVDENVLRNAGLVSRRRPIKILGNGSIDRGLTVRAHAFSGAAAKAIEAAGGKAEKIAMEAGGKAEKVAVEAGGKAEKAAVNKGDDSKGTSAE